MSGELVAHDPLTGERPASGSRYLGGVQHGSRSTMTGMAGLSFARRVVGGLADRVLAERGHDGGHGFRGRRPRRRTVSPAPSCPGLHSRAPSPTPWSSPRASVPTWTRSARPGVTPSSDLSALSIGSYVCQARAARQADQAVWDFVVAAGAQRCRRFRRRRQRECDGTVGGRDSLSHLRIHSDRDRATLLAGAPELNAQDQPAETPSSSRAVRSRSVCLAVVLIVAIVIVVLRRPDTPPTAVPPSAVPPSAVSPDTPSRSHGRNPRTPVARTCSWCRSQGRGSRPSCSIRSTRCSSRTRCCSTSPIRFGRSSMRSASRCSPFRTPRSSTIRCRRTRRCPTTTAAPRALAPRSRR